MVSRRSGHIATNCTGSWRSSKSGYRVPINCFTTSPRLMNARALPSGANQHDDFTLVYHLFSFERNEYIRVKTPLTRTRFRSTPSPTCGLRRTGTSAKCGTCSVIKFSGHPHLTRILMPRPGKAIPLRKDHPARATEMGEFRLPDSQEDAEQEALRFRPEEWGMKRTRGDSDIIFLNIGPQHPGTHGVLRIVLQLDGEEILDCVPEIGFHHRGAEKMGERQTWHTYIPYTDRVDYLGGVMNNLAYLTAVEKLTGITVPARAQVIRVMLAELFRIISHLVWYGTFAQDLGQLSPVFYTFNDRERAFAIIEAIARRADAPELVPDRRSSAGPAARLGRDVSRFPEIPAAAARRI